MSTIQESQRTEIGHCVLTDEGEILDGRKAGDPHGFGVSKVGYKRDQELGVLSSSIHVEIYFQGSCLCALQAQRRYVIWVIGYHRPIFRGRDDGHAPISAHVSQWNNGPCVLMIFVANTSSDIRKDLWWQPVDWLQRIP